jgi:hypothetical protein
VIYAVRNVGSGNAADLATYVVEKGKPLLTLAKCAIAGAVWPSVIVGQSLIHVKSPNDNAMPLIATHGWPGSVIELPEVAGPLTDPGRAWPARLGAPSTSYCRPATGRQRRSPASSPAPDSTSHPSVTPPSEIFASAGQPAAKI